MMNYIVGRRLKSHLWFLPFDDLGILYTLYYKEGKLNNNTYIKLQKKQIQNF